MTQHTRFATNLRAARARANLNQTDLGAKIGFGQGTITKWETGKSTPSVGQLVILAAALGITAADLLKGCEQKPERKVTKTSAKGGGSKTFGQPPFLTRRTRRQPATQVP